jgi:hypothetical protein
MLSSVWNTANMKTSLEQVMHSWGQRCDNITFFVSDKNKDVPAVYHHIASGVKVPIVKLPMYRREDHKFFEEKNQRPIWEKMWRTYSWIVDNAANSATWFVKVDDDAFLFANNLKRYLADKDPDEEHWFGHTLHNHVRTGGPSLNAGAVAVMSHKTLLTYGNRMKKMVLRKHLAWEQAERDGNAELAASLNGERMWTRICQDQPGSNEEFTTAICMRELGIKPSPTYDKKGRERFLIFQPADHLDIKKVANDWFWDGKPEHLGHMDDCCALDPVSFHNYKVRFVYTQRHERGDRCPFCCYWCAFTDTIALCVVVPCPLFYYPCAFALPQDEDGIMRLQELDKFEKYMEAHRGDKKFGDYSWIKKNIKLSPQREVLYFRKVLDFARLQTTP